MKFLLLDFLHNLKLRRISLAGLATVVSTSAYADHYGLDRLFYSFLMWCIAAAVLLGVLAAALNTVLNEKLRRHLVKFFALAGLVAYFLILGDLWKLPFTFPLLFGALLLVWIVEWAAFASATWAIVRARTKRH